MGSSLVDRDHLPGPPVVRRSTVLVIGKGSATGPLRHRPLCTEEFRIIHDPVDALVHTHEAVTVEKPHDGADDAGGDGV